MKDIYLKIHAGLQIAWQWVLRKFQGTQYNPPHYLRYGNRTYWYDDEAFVQLYMELSKGGCGDYREDIIVANEPDSPESYCAQNISYIRFYNELALRTPITLGNANCLCERHE